MPDAQPVRVAILTVSDSASRKERPDLSGPAVLEEVRRLGFLADDPEIVPDDPEAIRSWLVAAVDERQPDLIFTTGGTGLSPRDNTPEATAAVIRKTVPGLSEMMRLEGMKSTPRAMLSRGVAGVRGKTLIVNLPGSVKGARESIRAIETLLPHAVELIRGIPVRCGD